MASLDNRDDGVERGLMNRQTGRDDDDKSTLCRDRDDDEGVQDGLMTGLSPGTLTPSSGQTCVAGIAVAGTGDVMGPSISGEAVIAKRNGDMVDDRRQTCGLDDIDSM